MSSQSEGVDYVDPFKDSQAVFYTSTQAPVLPVGGKGKQAGKPTCSVDANPVSGEGESPLHNQM